jgi:hypothetical protein
MVYSLMLRVLAEKVEWSLHGPLPKLCPVIPTFNQNGRQAKNRKRGNEIFQKCSPLKLLSQSQPNFAPWVVPFQNCVRHFRPLTKMAATAELNEDFYGNFP